MKKIYNLQTQEILEYPRKDDLHIEGLDSNFIILTQIETTAPEYNIHTQDITSQYILDLDLKEYRQEWIIETKPPLADWDTFNVTMMTNPRFNQVYNQCLALAPIVANSLPTAMDQLTTKGCSLFRIIWGQLCTIGGATVEDRETWGNIAVANNLPQEFIDILRG